MDVGYLHIAAGRDALPAMDKQPFTAVLVVEQSASDEWRWRVTDWLIAAGCLYVVAWGEECAKWEDSADVSALEAAGWEDVPDDSFVMTTCHAQETLSEALWFAAHCAHHPTVALEKTLLIHISSQQRADDILGAYANAKNDV